jgi:[ribosomal protein S18]-alanine N-acetyltransferase
MKALTNWLSGRLLASTEPVLGEAEPRDAAALSALHAASFRRGWSEDEIERLLLDRQVIAHRAMQGGKLAGFILSRTAAGEAEILSVAVGSRWQGRGLGRKLLDLHLRRLAGLLVGTVFLEVEEGNRPALRLYAAAGFRQVGRRPGYYPRDEPPSCSVAISAEAKPCGQAKPCERGPCGPPAPSLL